MKGTFAKAFAAMLILEGFSLLSFVYPVLALPALVVLGILTLWLSLRDPSWGIYILFGELFVGSRGHLLEAGPISLRLVVFSAVVIAWIVNGIRNQELGIRNLPKAYWLLLIVVGFAVVRGLLGQNGIGNVFYDANGYLYLLILPAALAAVKDKATLENIFEILAAAIVVIALKGLVLFLWFAFALPAVATAYHWVITQDIGEITGEIGRASRIFMQSQFYALVGIFLYSLREKARWGIVAAAIFSVVLSLSRSLWLGAIAGAFFAGCILLWKADFRVALKKVAVIALLATTSFGLIWGLGWLAGGVSESVASRGGSPVGEAAGGARLLLLPELLREIKAVPVFGAGFGKVVAYRSYLPDRVTPQNPEGEIRSYAFEWGYLDTALKIGILGLIVYLLFIAKIFQLGFRNLQLTTYNLAVLAGLVALVVLNNTTPYLNHPLGIGYLIFVYSYLSVFRKENETSR